MNYRNIRYRLHPKTSSKAEQLNNRPSNHWMFLDIPIEEITLPIEKSLVSSVCTVNSYWLLEGIDDIADRIDSNSDLLHNRKFVAERLMPMSFTAAVLRTRLSGVSEDNSSYRQATKSGLTDKRVYCYTKSSFPRSCGKSSSWATYRLGSPRRTSDRS